VNANQARIQQQKQQQQLAFAALGDATRRAVFERVAAGPLAVVEIARGLPVSRPAVSQHLKVLKDAGLVQDRKQGNRRVYAVDPHAVAALRDYFERFWTRALTAFQKAAEKAEEEETWA
jgi:DNA-binding transcriptional ArsR family regulator